MGATFERKKKKDESFVLVEGNAEEKAPSG